MPAVQNVLVVGAGAAGAATAILLAEKGVSVDLVDIKPDLGTLGSGITLQGNALRIFRELGVWPQVRSEGFEFSTLGMRTPGPEATLVAELDDILTGGPDLPATMGMHRPAMARILLDRAVEVGAKVRFGTTYTSFVQDADGVEVTFANGSMHRYDLVVGADGIRSSTRLALGIELETVSTGMGIWRAFTRRPEGVVRTDLFYGGPCYIAGYCPTGEDSLYAYLVEDATDRSTVSPEESLALMRELSAPYHGRWDDIRATLTDPSRVSYTWFESHLLEAPWHRGRVVLIGDAAHACPPTLAQGAAQALEDASVLCRLLMDADTLGDELFDSFTARRMPRVSAVVEGSLQIGRWMLAHEEGDVPGLMTEISMMLAQPA